MKVARVFLLVATGLGVYGATPPYAYLPTSKPAQTIRDRGGVLPGCRAPLRPGVPESALALVQKIGKAIVEANPQTFQRASGYPADRICFNLEVGDADNGHADLSTGVVTLSTGALKTGNVGRLATLLCHELAHITMAHGAFERSHEALSEFRPIHPVVRADTAWTEALRTNSTAKMTEREEALVPKEDQCNWKEVEADNAGMALCLRAGFDPKDFAERELDRLRESPLSPSTTIYPGEVDGAIASPTAFQDLPRHLKQRLAQQKDFSYRHCVYRIENRHFTNADRGQNRHPETCWRAFNAQVIQTEILKGTPLKDALTQDGAKWERQFGPELERVRKVMEQLAVPAPDQASQGQSGATTHRVPR